MSHSGHSMGGGSSMSGMGSMGSSSNVYYQEMYWAAVGSVIGAFVLVNVYTKFLAWQRTRSKNHTPARPRSLVAVAIASATAITREVAHTPMGWLSLKSRSIVAPTTGKALLVLANLMVLLVLCFYRLNPNSRYDWEDIGYRTGRITACQLPLLFLLAGKHNIIAGLVGSSYERINWLHRWAARCMLIIATIHMAFWFRDWNRFKYIPKKVKTDALTQRGLAAWGVLAWIVFSSMTPIRGWAYELFVIQHIISFTALVALLYFHVPEEVRIFIWISVAIFFLDRLLRAGYYLYNNLFKFHAQPNAAGHHRDFWGSRAEFKALPGGCTRITISDPQVKWQPGQHVFLTCHGLAPLQAHPFTISSIPADGKMEFIVQSRSGGTKRFLRHAEACLPATREDVTFKKHVGIEGPYGRVRPLKQFDSVVLFAGSTGSTFTTPLLRDLLHDARSEKRIVTRRIKYVWVVKSGSQLEWFRHQLSQVVEDTKALREVGMDIAVSISLYVTCDDAFTTKHSGFLSGARKSLQVDGDIGPCAAPISESIQANEKSPSITIQTTEKNAVSMTINRPHKNCCCRGDVDENDTDAPLCTCSCCGIEETSSDDASSSITDVKKKESPPLLHPEIHLFSGRPMIKDITRTVLEQALGESAVVACGPQGLINDVRRASVSLSDERAVHKGTGAQGIWLHCEAFGY